MSTWLGLGATTDFDDAGNWLGTVPGHLDVAQFELPLPIDVHLSTAHRVCLAVFEDGSYTFTGATFRTGPQPNFGDRSLFVGSPNGAATLTLDNCRFECPNVTDIASAPGSIGTLHVTGPNAVLATSTNAEGWLAAGFNGDGKLLVDSGGTVTAMITVAGDGWGGAGGLVSVSGQATSLATEQLHIGGRCPGNLTIEAGATVTTTDIFTCGTYAEVGGSGRGIGLARIRDAGSHLDMSAATGFLGIGNEGDGTLILEQGGTMTSGAQGVFVGTWPGSTGTLVIRDPGSLWAAHNPGLGFTVGLDSATGSVTIENGGALSVSGTTWIGFGGTSVGTLESDGAGSLVSCPVIVVGRELPELTSGSLTVSNGASVAASDRIEVRASGHVVIEGGVLDSPLVAIDGGNLEGAGSIAGDLQNTGSLRVTRASGAHLLASVYVQDHDGSMIVEAGGTVAGQDYGVLQVSQVAFLDGELRLAFDASYTPSVGDSFHVLEYGLRAGSFSSITASGLPANLDLSASYGTSELTITVGVLATSFCECAAGGPCGNDSPDAGCANSTLSGAHLSAAGSRSVARDDLVLTAMNLPPSQPGLFFMGRSIAAAPFGDGLRCVGGTLYRFPIAQASGAGLISLGPGLAGYASTHFPAAGQIMAGQVRSFQCWYRDPGTPCGSAVNLSNAVELVFAP